MTEWLSAAFLNDWFNLGVRWFHLVAGISWIGSSFYFMWLDSSFEAPARPREDVEGEVWMVHGGFFYLVEKRLMKPGKIPETLHWFKWEATLTWISGVMLLTIVYYLTGGAYLIDPSVADITPGAAAGVGVGVIVVSWLFYDFFWNTRFAESSPGAATGVSLAALGGLVFALCHVLSGRGAYIHVGSVLGTLMVANVWMRILPAQRRMLQTAEAGKVPDYSMGKKGKRRSVHNSYMTLPVLFIMISNHFPMTYGHEHNWIVLLLMMVLGGGVRHWMIAREKQTGGRWALIPAAASLAAVMVMTAPSTAAPQNDTGMSAAAGWLDSEEMVEHVSFRTVREIIDRRCISCHSESPTDTTFGAAAQVVKFDDPARIRALAGRIKVRAVDSKTMPLANKTGMTDEERATLAAWIKQGAQTR